VPDEDLNLPEYDECKIELRGAEGGYVTTVTLSRERSFASDQPIPVDLDTLNQFMGMSSDPLGYGQLLYDTFLAGRPREGLTAALNEAQAGKRHLRIQLDIPPDAKTLHTLTWEWLYSPGTDAAFAASPEVSLSRFMRIDKPLGEPVETRPLKILVVISNPANLSDYNLPALDPNVERQNIEAALIKVQGQVKCEFLEGYATLGNIRNQLEQGQFHVLHVLSHGYMKQQKGYLLLQDQEGRGAPVDENIFDDLFLGQHNIRLVVLAACLSAARSQTNAFVGLGPRLVEKGIPAVVAMQRRVEVSAAQLFTEHFYQHLSQYGVVDAAVNEARYRLYLDPARRASGDWGIPVLFMRTDKGELFYPAPVDVAARIPPSYRDRFEWVLREFVNREDHRLMFQRMIQRDEEERILFSHGLSGMGKTTLLKWCEAWCLQEGLPWGEVDFLETKPWDYALVLSALADGLAAWLPASQGGAPGADSFAEFKTLVTQTAGSGDKRATDPNVRLTVTLTFLRALAGLPSDRPIALFIDAMHALDKAPDLREWLWGELFASFQNKTLALGHVTLVAADRQGPPPDPDHRWYHTLSAMPLKPLTREDFIQYARRRGFRKEEEDELGRYYDAMVAMHEEMSGADNPITPRILSGTLDRLARQWHK